MGWTCLHCGYENDEEDAYCLRCGAFVGDARDINDFPDDNEDDD